MACNEVLAQSVGVNHISSLLSISFIFLLDPVISTVSAGTAESGKQAHRCSGPTKQIIMTETQISSADVC